jgi:predicted negative regulator of RcsB-dependent stress response
MAYDLEEQEQIDTLKAWWKQYGSLATWLVIAALMTYVAWVTWNTYQRNQSIQASQLYDEVEKALTAKENSKVQGATAAVVEKFGRTTYATMASMVAAKSAFDANDLKTAKSQLQWVIDHTSLNEYKALAKLRLAAISLDEKKYDEGLQLLAGEFPVEFEGDVADRKGDFFVAQNKIAEARASYQKALEKITEKNPGHQLIQVKLDAIGGLPNKVVTATEKK